MGKNLLGEDIGTGFSQNKDGKYVYRYTANGKRKSFSGPSLMDLYYRVDSILHLGLIPEENRKQYENDMAVQLEKKKINNKSKIDSIQKEAIYDLTQNNTTSGYGVYLITDGEYVKIGVAKDVFARIQDLQIGNARKLTLIIYEKFANAYEIECMLHSKFSNKRIIGEWFDIFDEVKKIKSIKELLEK